MADSQTKLEIKMAKLEKDIDYIRVSLDSNFKENNELRQSIKEFINSVEKQLESKAEKSDVDLIRSNLYKIVGIVFSLLGGLVIFLIRDKLGW